MDDQGWWANKYGWQAGLKYIDVFGLNNVDLQVEFNTVRPYTYSHKVSSENYGHYQQSLAHPLGANFNEYLFFADYKIKKLLFHIQLMKAKYGGKIKNDPTSYGNDIFMSNNDRPDGNDNETYNTNEGYEQHLYDQEENEEKHWFKILLKYHVSAKAKN